MSETNDLSPRTVGNSRSKALRYMIPHVIATLMFLAIYLTSGGWPWIFFITISASLSIMVLLIIFTRFPYVELSEEGLTIQNAPRLSLYLPWEETKRFFVYRSKFQGVTIMRLISFKRIWRGRDGQGEPKWIDCYLFASFLEGKPKALAAELNDRRARALKGND